MMKAWHFLKVNKKLQFGDNRIVKVGETYSCKGEVILYKNGMHGSRDILDALTHARGPIVCRVEITGDIIEEGKKIVGRSRKVLAMANIKKELAEFARMCALDVAYLWAIPDFAVEYLKTGNEKLQYTTLNAAQIVKGDAARSTQRAAVGDGLVDTSRKAALDARMAVAWVASRDSSRPRGLDFAWAAAGCAYWNAAWNRQNNRLLKMIA